MACKFVILLACACALVGAARVSRREAPASTPLQDIQKHAEDLQKQLVESITKFTSSKSAADYKKTLTEGTDSVLQQLSALSSSWGGAIKDASGKAKEVLEEARTNIDKTAADLRKAHPEVEQQASALGDRISQALTNALQVGAARVSRREAPASTPLQDIQKHAEDLQKQLVESITKFTSSKSAADYKKTLTEGTDSVLQQLSALSSSWGGAIKDASGKAKEVLEEARTNIDKTAADLRKAHPEVEQQASALGDRISQALTNALQESQKVAQEVQKHAAQTNKELAPKLQAAYDDLAKQVQDVQKKLHEAAAAPKQ